MIFFNGLITVALLALSVVAAMFWLGTKESHDEWLAQGTASVFLAKASSACLLMGGVAVVWWACNWLLKRTVRAIINLKVLAIQLSGAVVIGACAGAAVFCWA